MHLTVDFRALNAVTPQTSPLLVEMPEIMAVIVQGDKWFSVIDLANAFFFSPLEKKCW